MNEKLHELAEAAAAELRGTLIAAQRDLRAAEVRLRGIPQSIMPNGSAAAAGQVRKLLDDIDEKFMLMFASIQEVYGDDRSATDDGDTEPPASEED